jgi:hypothetical protein
MCELFVMKQTEVGARQASPKEIENLHDWGLLYLNYYVVEKDIANLGHVWIELDETAESQGYYLDKWEIDNG